MKKIISIFVCSLFIISIFSGVLGANKIENISKEIEKINLQKKSVPYEPILKLSDDQQIIEKKIQLTEEQIQKIDEYVNTIESDERRENVKNVLNQIISEDGIFDLEKAISLSKDYYNSVNRLSGVEPFCKVVDEPLNENGTMPVSGGQSFGTSTVFSAPFDNCYSWGDGTWGIDDWAYGCNRFSGAIGAYASGFIGGATAEAQQQTNFYIGAYKTINIDAKIIYLGGGNTVGIGAFAGTQKTWWRDDVYGQTDIDPWIGWDDILEIIFDLISFMGYGTPQNIKEAIETINVIWELNLLLNKLYFLINAGEAEIHHVTLSFTASPGYHTILAGLRASASGCLTGTGVSVAYGAVESITIDGYAPPLTPTVSGPSTGYTGNTYSFNAVSTDPNNDDIQYQFDWGDGNIGEWTNFEDSGTTVSASHSYEYGGAYNVRVYARDRDLLASNYGSHSITISSSFPNMPTNPIPDYGSTNVGINTDLAWNGGGGDSTIHYQIYFGTSSNPPYYDTIGPFTPSHTTITYTGLPTLSYDTQYYWKIITYNDEISIPGPIWSFTTIQDPNDPPNIPAVPQGATNGYLGCTYSYSTTTTDPNNDMVRYGWDWGDGSPIDWGVWHESGDTAWGSHTWYSQGTYHIRVKAKDFLGLESDFSSQTTITIDPNQGPGDPIITGPNDVDIDTLVQFNITATDPDNGLVRFGIDWKYYSQYEEPSFDDWTSYVNSGETITIDHAFNVGGYYDIAFVTQDELGLRSNYVTYRMNIRGGEVILEFTDTWTEPNQFLPGKEIKIGYDIKNSGNRDGYNLNLFYFLDGHKIGGFHIIKCLLIEAGETQMPYELCTWPNDWEVHEIKYIFGPVQTYLYKSAVENYPPSKPSRPSGPSSGESGKEYTYSSSATDPNDHQLYYKWDWGDGTESDWLGPYGSGITCEASHTWSEEGSYSIRAKAKDIYDTESDWSDSLPITMPFDLPGSQQSSPTPQTQPSTQPSQPVGTTQTITGSTTLSDKTTSR